MLSIDDHTGTVTFLLGVIVLVMVGIGLTTLVDKRMGLSSREVAVRGNLEADRDRLATVKKRVALLSSRQADIGKGDGNGRTTGEMQNQLAELEARRSGLVLSLAKETRSLDLVNAAFDAYRERYCRTVRAAAVGEKLGDLKTREGRLYSAAVIVKVTDAGLEIRHEYGTARVLASDLDVGLRNRFQWE